MRRDIERVGYVDVQGFFVVLRDSQGEVAGSGYCRVGFQVELWYKVACDIMAFSLCMSTEGIRALQTVLLRGSPQGRLT